MNCPIECDASLSPAAAPEAAAAAVPAPPQHGAHQSRAGVPAWHRHPHAGHQQGGGRRGVRAERPPLPVRPAHKDKAQEARLLRIRRAQVILLLLPSF